MSSLSAELSAIAGSAFAAEGLSESFGRVTVSDRPDLAQFQCNGALAAARQEKVSPRSLAERVADRLKQNPVLENVGTAGPGFININVADAALESRAGAFARDERLGTPQTGTGKTLVLDFGGANVAKAMHEIC